MLPCTAWPWYICKVNIQIGNCIRKVKLFNAIVRGEELKIHLTQNSRKTLEWCQFSGIIMKTQNT